MSIEGVFVVSIFGMFAFAATFWPLSRHWFRVLLSRRWPRTLAYIDKVSFDQVPYGQPSRFPPFNRATLNRLTFKCSYTVESKNYQGACTWVYLLKSRAQRLRPRQRVYIRYKPSDPSKFLVDLQNEVSP
jgi:hypothetical protein